MNEDIKQDRFITKFIDRLPTDKQEIFSVEQLQAVKMAFGARSWEAHAVDFRGTFSFFSWVSGVGLKSYFSITCPAQIR